MAFSWIPGVKGLKLNLTNNNTLIVKKHPLKPFKNRSKGHIPDFFKFINTISSVSQKQNAKMFGYYPNHYLNFYQREKRKH